MASEVACSTPLPITWQAATLLCEEKGEPLEYRFRRVLGLPEQQRDLSRVVFCPSWSKKEVRRWVFRLVEAPAAWRVIVLLGSKVKSAFDYARPFFSYENSSLNPDVRLVYLPGPRDRAWNDARLVQRTRQLLREVAPTLPWGLQHDPFTALSFSLRCAAECTLWAWAIPRELREKAQWTEDEFMVALDAAEVHGIDRARGEYIARVGGKGTAS